MKFSIFNALMLQSLDHGESLCGTFIYFFVILMVFIL